MRDLQKTPGNALLAVALVEVLGAGGDSARRTRVERALGGDGALRRRRADWIRPELLREVFRDSAVDERLARRVGHALVAPRGLGLLLCYAGIATPEKAYRRVDQLLARERPGDRFVANEIEMHRARIEFHPKEPCPEDAIFCSVRHGMLEAMPALYGLLPAKARETACAHRGDPKCTFEIEWRTVPRTWLMTGAVSGASLGIAMGSALGGGLLGPLGWALTAAIPAGLLGAAAGRSVDLSRQLAAIASSRFGQLALLDQADRVLAEKMDALAKLERVPDSAPVAGLETGLSRIRDQRPEPHGGHVRPELLHRFNDSVAVLQRALSRLGEGADVETELAVCAEAGRGLRAVGVELSESSEASGDRPRIEDLAEIVRRGIAAAAPGQPDTLEIALTLEIESAPVRAHAFQLEQVVIQLLLNSAEAAGSEGRIDVVVRSSPEGFELAISDNGAGIDPEVLDRLFDPFFAPTSAGAESGLGLPLCYQVIDRHGGELSVQSEPNRGTTVTVALPADWDEPTI